jgi:hypothetical protein
MNIVENPKAEESMARRLITMVILLCLLFTAGCIPVQPAATEDAAAAESAAQDATLQALAGTAQSLSNTASALQSFQPTKPTVKPTSTPSPASITITGIQNTGPGRAIVSWDAIGDFPSGYKIVWTDVMGKPSYPENINTYAGDPYARSAMISGVTGKIYYVRVCRFINEGCDVYSDLGIFVFTGKGATPTTGIGTPTVKPGTPKPIGGGTGGTTGGGTGGGTTGVKIVITGMSGGSTGKAYMTWTAEGSFTNGFKIVYSKTNSTPTFGTDSYFIISDSGTRAAYVDGEPGSKYYYRICRFTGTVCDSYSPTYTYTFPGVAYTATPDLATITLTGISDGTTGFAIVDWTATGSFPNGFKVVYSKTHPLPTLADTYYYVSNGSLRTATVPADPDGTYYFRVCKYYAGTCVVYSNVISFTLAPAPTATPDGSTISNLNIIDTTVGNANLTWDASGAFPNGFKILYSTTDTDPLYATASKIAVSSGSARSFAVSGLPGTVYYYRVCKFTGSDCTIYSDTISFMYAEPPVDSGFVLAAPVMSSAQADLTWTVSPTSSLGYKVFWGFSNPPDTARAYLTSPTATTYSATGLGPSSTYYFRLCKWNGTFCTAYSNTVSGTTP